MFVPSREPRRLGRSGAFTSAAGRLAAACLLAVAGAVLTTPAAPATRADLSVDVWTTFGTPGSSLDASMASCKAFILDRRLDDACFGLQNGQALGLIRALEASDELDQALGVRYDDETTVPAPESPTNGVVRVWNDSTIYMFVAAGASSFQADAANGQVVYNVPPDADLSGPTLDAEQGELTFVLEGELDVGFITTGNVQITKRY